MSQTQTADDDGEQAQEQEPEQVHVETGGDLFKSVTNLLDVLVDECKVRFDEDETSITAVDPANVGMVDLSVPTEAFDSYRVAGSHVLGLDLDRLDTTTGYARKGGNSDDDPGDPVTLEQVGRRIYVRVEPEDRMTRTGSFMSIDPDSIRQEPDLPDLTLPWEGDVDARSFRDALREVKKRFDHVRLSPAVEESGDATLGEDDGAYLSMYAMERGEKGGERYVREEDEFRTQEKVLSGDGDPDDASLYSLDYLVDMADGLVRAGFETVHLRLGDEFPLKMEFHESRWGISGTFMLAPRIASEPGESDRATRLDAPTWGDRFEGDDEEADDDRDECFAGDCENPVSEDAAADGYPLCEDHDTDEARSLYDDRHADEEDE